MTLRRRLLAISLAALGCESIAPRTTPDAAVDAGAVVDVSDAPASDIVDASMVDAPDVQTPDAPDVRTVDIVDAPVADASDVVTEDIVDATLVDAPDVVTEDIVDATVLDTLDAVSPDVVDASAADTADRVTSDSVDASVNPFPSTGADGPFPGTRVAAGGVISLEPRVWHFTTINVPPGVTVRAALGSAVLELRATGDVVIEGAINLSGGNGLSGFMGYLMRGGGDTGTPTNSSTAGRGGLGSPAPTPAGCLSGGNLGGGAGGHDEPTCPGSVYAFVDRMGSGGGGGGYAGGAGGGLSAGASHLLDFGGQRNGQGAEPDLLGTSLSAYAGSIARFEAACSQGGGGGSIGASAARDLAARSGLRPGSGGGGGESGRTGSGIHSGSGGGGGGGALRISSPTLILLSPTASLRVAGGAGGRGDFPLGTSTASPLRYPGAGGGGSGGLIYLAAPQVVLNGVLSAVGGSGGVTGGSGCQQSFGGNGGLGRIRLSVDPLQCVVRGSSTPPIPTGCAPSPDGGVPGQAYVGMWPN